MNKLIMNEYNVNIKQFGFIFQATDQIQTDAEMNISLSCIYSASVCSTLKSGSEWLTEMAFTASYLVKCDYTHVFARDHIHKAFDDFCLQERDFHFFRGPSLLYLYRALIFYYLLSTHDWT